MRQPLIDILKPYAAVAALCAAGSVALYIEVPAVLGFLDDLLANHAILLGSWLFLAAAGADYVLTTIYRKIRFAEVGAKSAAQLSISRGDV